MKPDPHLDRDRYRFNCGYHDGADEAAKGFPVRTYEEATTHHFDPVYADGYRHGVADFKAGKYRKGVTLSDEAWTRSGRTDGVTPYCFAPTRAFQHTTN